MKEWIVETKAIEGKMDEWNMARAGFTEQWVIEVNSVSRNRGDDWHPWFEGEKNRFMLPTTLENCILRFKAASKERLVIQRPEDYRLWNVITNERIPIAILGL